MENLLHKMEVALFWPADKLSYAAINVTHQNITNVHSPPDRGRLMSSTKDHKCAFHPLFPDRQDRCMPRTKDHERAFSRISPLDRTGVSLLQLEPAPQSWVSRRQFSFHQSAIFTT